MLLQVVRTLGAVVVTLKPAHRRRTCIPGKRVGCSTPKNSRISRASTSIRAPRWTRVSVRSRNVMPSGSETNTSNLRRRLAGDRAVAISSSVITARTRNPTSSDQNRFTQSSYNTSDRSATKNRFDDSPEDEDTPYYRKASPSEDYKANRPTQGEGFYRNNPNGTNMPSQRPSSSYAHSSRFAKDKFNSFHDYSSGVGGQTSSPKPDPSGYGARPQTSQSSRTSPKARDWGYNTSGQRASANGYKRSDTSPGKGGGYSSSYGSGSHMDAQAISGLRFLGFSRVTSDSGLPSEDELKAAYRKKAMEYHPDRKHNHDQQDFASEQFKKAKAHYDNLVQLKLKEAQERKERNADRFNNMTGSGSGLYGGGGGLNGNGYGRGGLF